MLHTKTICLNFKISVAWELMSKPGFCAKSSLTTQTAACHCITFTWTMCQQRARPIHERTIYLVLSRHFWLFIVITSIPCLTLPIWSTVHFWLVLLSHSLSIHHVQKVDMSNMNWNFHHGKKSFKNCLENIHRISSVHRSSSFYSSHKEETLRDKLEGFRRGMGGLGEGVKQCYSEIYTADKMWRCVHITRLLHRTLCRRPSSSVRFIISYPTKVSY